MKTLKATRSLLFLKSFCIFWLLIINLNFIKNIDRIQSKAYSEKILNGIRLFFDSFKFEYFSNHYFSSFIYFLTISSFIFFIFFSFSQKFITFHYFKNETRIKYQSNEINLIKKELRIVFLSWFINMALFFVCTIMIESIMFKNYFSGLFFLTSSFIFSISFIFDIKSCFDIFEKWWLFIFLSPIDISIGLLSDMEKNENNQNIISDNLRGIIELPNSIIKIIDQSFLYKKEQYH